MSRFAFLALAALGALVAPTPLRPLPDEPAPRPRRSPQPDPLLGADGLPPVALAETGREPHRRRPPVTPEEHARAAKAQARRHRRAAKRLALVQR